MTAVIYAEDDQGSEASSRAKVQLLRINVSPFRMVSCRKVHRGVNVTQRNRATIAMNYDLSWSGSA